MLLRARFQNGNIQQGGQTGIGPGEGQGHRAVPGGNTFDIRQPPAVASRAAGGTEGSFYVGGGEGRAVRKHHAVTEGQLVGQRFRIIGVGRAQQRLRREGLIQLKQPLVEKRGHRLLNAIGTGEGIQRLTFQIGQGEHGGQTAVIFLRWGHLRRKG